MNENRLRALNTPMVTSAARVYATEHSTCAMCESNLEIKHEVDKPQLKVKEEAHCPSCGIRVRSGHHLMH